MVVVCLAVSSALCLLLPLLLLALLALKLPPLRAAPDEVSILGDVPVLGVVPILGEARELREPNATCGAGEPAAAVGRCGTR